MKSARLASAGFGGALALMTLGTARAEVVTIAPDGSVQRSENAAPIQQAQTPQQAQGQYAPQHRRNDNDQETPHYDLTTPEAAAGMPGGGRIPDRSRTRPDDRDHRDHRHDRDNRHRYRDRYGRDITIIGDNTDVYIIGRPGYGYGYPIYGYPYNGGYSYYGNSYGNGWGGYYGNGQTVIAGQPAMAPAWANMQPATGMGNPFGNTRPQPQPRLPRVILNQGRRR